MPVFLYDGDGITFIPICIQDDTINSFVVELVSSPTSGLRTTPTTTYQCHSECNLELQCVTGTEKNRHWVVSQ